jgi:hypothetical protein
VLVAESGTDSNALAALRATAAEHGGSALGLHAGSEAVGLDALAAVRLKCALGHGNALLNRLEKNFAWSKGATGSVYRKFLPERQVSSIAQTRFGIQ